MTLMHMERISAPYELDWFKWDLKFAYCAMYLGVPAPLLAFLAKAWPFLDPTPARTAATVSYPLLFAALGCALAGAAFLAFWARLAQAAAIGDEISEKKRYQLRGFAELIDRPGMVAEYRTLARRMGVAFPW